MVARIMLAAAALMLVLATGCPNKQAMLMNKKRNLVDKVKSYNEHISWRDFESASYYVAPEKRSEFLGWAVPLKHGFTMESFTVLEVELSPSGERAAVVVSRSYILAPSVTLQTEEFIQEWVLIDGDWYLAGPPY